MKPTTMKSNWKIKLLWWKQQLSMYVINWLLFLWWPDLTIKILLWKLSQCWKCSNDDWILHLGIKAHLLQYCMLEYANFRYIYESNICEMQSYNKQTINPKRKQSLLFVALIIPFSLPVLFIQVPYLRVSHQLNSNRLNSTLAVNNLPNGNTAIEWFNTIDFSITD